MYGVKILKDSLAPCGKRLTTWELTYPRFIHSELMTHRLFSRNSASSRAIPTSKLLDRIKNHPAMPVWWGKNQAGMQAREELLGPTRQAAVQTWLAARDMALASVEHLMDLGLHKQVANRILEPWMYITVIVSATEFSNWFHLRNHGDAQPEIAWVAKEMYQQYNDFVPTLFAETEWHMPLIEDKDFGLIRNIPEYNPDNGATFYDRINGLKKVSVGRCARVSYLTHDGKRDLSEDIKLHDRLCAGPLTGDPGHWSPFEHVAMALGKPERHGNFIGWLQYRKTFEKEHFGEKMP